MTLRDLDPDDNTYLTLPELSKALADTPRVKYEEWDYYDGPLSGIISYLEKDSYREKALVAYYWQGDREYILVDASDMPNRPKPETWEEFISIYGHLEVVGRLTR